MEVFDKIFKYLLSVEGGYSNDKYDAGGETKYGIIKEEARRWGYRGAMRDLPLDTAKEIYKKKYYLRNRLDELNDSRIALSICDWTVNSGSWGLKKAQVALNKLKCNLYVDGVIGDKTLKALNDVNTEEFLKTYHDLQREFYRNIVRSRPKQKVFLKGWLNRVDRKEKYIENMEV